MATNKRNEKQARTRAALIAAGRTLFAEQGYGSAAMEDITAAASVTRGALYHNFDGKRGLFEAVVAEVDLELATAVADAVVPSGDDWDDFVTEGRLYVEMSLRPDIQRILLLDGPAVLGDPSSWPGQVACLRETEHTVQRFVAAGTMKPVNPAVTARLINEAAFGAALWVAGSDAPDTALRDAVQSLEALLSGLRA